MKGLFQSLNLFILISTVSLIPNVSKARDVLLLGDSHVVGDFGKFLHNSLTNSYKDKKIFTIGIGGARAVYFVDVMKNFCCGSIVRKGEKGVSENLEVFGSKTLNQVVLNKDYKGNLVNVLEDPKYSFTTLILNLGSNFYNKNESDTKDYITLISNVLSTNKVNKIIWITPFQRIGLGQRIEMVEKVITHFQGSTNVKFFQIRSDVNELINKGIGGADLKSTHYWGDSAKVWSDYVLKKLKPILDINN